MKCTAGMDPNQAISPATQLQWNKDLPQDLLAEEARRRDAMYAYTAVQNVAVGDVIQVQPCMPHSLQHGVRVVEFQTPHYERFILSFGQKVLTQSGWDTREALLLANTQAAPPASIKIVAPGIDLLADCSAFQVVRIMLAAGDSKILPWESLIRAVRRALIRAMRWLLVFLGSCVSVRGRQAGTPGKTAPNRLYTKVLPEDAFYIPATGEQLQLTNAGPGPASILVALPYKESNSGLPGTSRQ